MTDVSGPAVPRLITGFFHGGIAVSDMDRSLAFYRDALELEVHFDVVLDAVEYVREVLGVEMRDARLVYLTVPGGAGVYVELIEYHGTDGRAVVPRAWDPGTGHLCFHVSDAAALHARVLSMGFRSRSPGVATIPVGPNKGGRAAYLLDPDGYHVEIFQRPAPVGDPPDQPDGGTDVPTR
jgi:lactoylglutathione lyase